MGCRAHTSASPRRTALPNAWSARYENPFRYCGEYFDDELGTVYLRARYYDPGTGRFTTQDGWEYMDLNDPLSLNLYTYCGNNPVRFVDPSGHEREDDKRILTDEDYVIILELGRLYNICSLNNDKAGMDACARAGAEIRQQEKYLHKYNLGKYNDDYNYYSKEVTVKYEVRNIEIYQEDTVLQKLLWAGLFTLAGALTYGVLDGLYVITEAADTSPKLQSSDITTLIYRYEKSKYGPPSDWKRKYYTGWDYVSYSESTYRKTYEEIGNTNTFKPIWKRIK